VCVRWCGILSFWYQLTAGVRQGGILSPVLFAVYMDTLIVRLRLEVLVLVVKLLTSIMDLLYMQMI